MKRTLFSSLYCLCNNFGQGHDLGRLSRTALNWYTKTNASSVIQSLLNQPTVRCLNTTTISYHVTGYTMQTNWSAVFRKRSKVKGKSSQRARRGRERPALLQNYCKRRLVSFGLLLSHSENHYCKFTTALHQDKTISQLSNHVQSLKVQNSGGPLDNQTWQTECSIGQSAVVWVRKPNFGSFCCSQQFAWPSSDCRMFFS